VKRFSILTALIALQLFAQRGNAASEDLVQYVSTLQGTDSSPALSHGNTLPLVGAPWGMTDWSPQTVGGSCFEYRRTQLSGIRATHQPSPWMGDYGQFALMPQIGDLAVGAEARASKYNINDGVFRPDYLRVKFDRYDVIAEVTATQRCGVLRFTFDKGDSGRIIFDPAADAHIQISGRTIRGYTKANSGGAAKNFASYFVAVLDRDITGFGTSSGSEIHPKAIEATGRNIAAYVEFKTASDRKV
jgi:putative alpha-1,2-mannosidase